MEKTEKEAYIAAGKIASETVSFAKKFIKPGMKLIEIAEKIEGKIVELGGGLGFPVNLSLNEVAAHYTPSSNDETKAEGILKVDLGVEVEGFIADTAFSLDLTEDKRYSEMLKLNEDILKETLKIIKQGTEVGEIGNSIYGKIEEYNKKNSTKYSVITNLSGHSLDENEIHAGLTIPNYRNNNKNELDDIAIAIEPFLTTGAGEIYEGKESEIFMLESDLQVRDSDARKILKFVKENYKTRPFCKRWLEKQKFTKLDFTLKTLSQQGIFHNFPVLIEKSKMPVSQFEHTVIIDEDAVVSTL
jgi:methionyl aminopeptidase